MKTRAARGAALLVMVAAVAWALVASGSPRVLLVGPSTSDPAVVRLRDELLVLGLAVEMVVGSQVADLPALVRERGAEAGVLVQASPPDVLVWVDAARVGGATTPEPVTHEATTARDASDLGLLALRAIETVRARLLPVPARVGDDAGATVSADAAPAEPAPAATPPSASIAPTTLVQPKALPGRAPDRPGSTDQRRRRAAAFVGPGLVASPGGAPVGLVVEAVARIPVVRALDLEVMALLPTWPVEVMADEGVVRLRLAAFGGGLDLPFTPRESRLRADLGLGVGGLLVVFDGDAHAPYRAAEGARLAVLPWAHAGGAYAFTPAVSLRADLLLALARPEPVVRAGGREVAAVAEPALVPALGVEIAP